MSEGVVAPLWGGHPHFLQQGLQRVFHDLLIQWKDAFDIVEIDLSDSNGITMRAFREPLLEPPEGTVVPPGMIWVPNISRRRPLATLDEVDATGELRDAVLRFAETIPYRREGGRWPRGRVEMEIRRDGVSLKIPVQVGDLVIYAEGRRRQLAPETAYWQTRTSLYPRALDASASDLLVAGGPVEYIMERFRSDPFGRFADAPDPIRVAGTHPIPFSMDFALDAFV